MMVTLPPDYRPTEAEEFMNPIQVEYFRQKLLRWRNDLLREADGIHLSYVGENVIATYVTRNIGVVYHVQITPEAAMYIDR